MTNTEQAMASAKAMAALEALHNEVERMSAALWEIAAYDEVTIEEAREIARRALSNQ